MSQMPLLLVSFFLVSALRIRRVATNVSCPSTSKAEISDSFSKKDVQLQCACNLAASSSSSSSAEQVENDATVIITWSILDVSQDVPQWVFAHGVEEIEESTEEDEYSIIAEGGNSGGDACAFPFKVIEKDDEPQYHFHCARSGRGDARCWCSTQPEFSTKLQKWGFCPCAFPTPGTRFLAEFGTSPAKFCQFPFKYKGITYWECTTDHQIDGICWCGTTYDVDKDGKWGYCPCAGLAFKGVWGPWEKWSSCQCGELRFRSRQCRLPPKVEFYPEGRAINCKGRSIDVAMCACGFEFALGSTKRLLSLRERAVVQRQPQNRKLPKDAWNLVIANSTTEDTGLYTCNIFQISKVVPYDQVQSKRLAVFHLNVVDVSQAEMLLTPKTPQRNGQYGDDWIEWNWSEWQICDRTGMLGGEKRKYGLCYTRHSLGKDLKSQLLPDLLPCRSPLLHSDKRQRLKKFTDYVQVVRCNVRGDAVKKEHTLVEAEPGKLPPMPQQPHRHFRRVYSGDKLVLKCVDAVPWLPVAWQFDDPVQEDDITPLFRWIVNRGKADGRGSLIDPEDNLNFEYVLESSAGYYSCFVNRSLSVTYRLAVTARVWKVLDAIKGYSVYLALAVVTIVFALASLSIIQSGVFTRSKH